MLDESAKLLDDKSVKLLVMERLSFLPSGARLVMENGEALTKEQLIDHVKKSDETGEEYAEMELLYLRNTVKRYVPK